jgi:hypothetical protein
MRCTIVGGISFLKVARGLLRGLGSSDVGLKQMVFEYQRIIGG